MYIAHPFLVIIPGGAGGKGTWGKQGEIYEENDVDCKDAGDPNYDSDAQVNQIVSWWISEQKAAAMFS